jgi:hypothetical protein
MSTPRHPATGQFTAEDREGLAPLPPTSGMTPVADRLGEQGGDGAVADARADRETRLSGDEAQLRLPFAEQPHGRATRT